MERYYDDPELGRLILKPGKSSEGTGYEGVCKRDGKKSTMSRCASIST